MKHSRFLVFVVISSFILAEGKVDIRYRIDGKSMECVENEDIEEQNLIKDCQCQCSEPTSPFPTPQSTSPSPAIPTTSSGSPNSINPAVSSSTLDPKQNPTEMPEPKPVPTKMPEPKPVPTKMPEPKPVPTGIPEPKPVPTKMPEPKPVPTKMPEPKPVPTGKPVSSPFPSANTEHPSSTSAAPTTPTTSAASSTEATTSEATTTDSATNTPTTEATTFEATTSEVPTTETTTSEAPTTEATTTEATTSEATTTHSATNTPTTEATTSEATTTEATTSEATTSEATTSEAPTTEAPTTEVKTTEAPLQSNLCSRVRQSVCADGDPHYRTLDKSHYEYSGTCPLIFSQPRVSNPEFEFFTVKIKSFVNHHNATVVQSTQIEMFNHTIFMDVFNNVLIDGVQQEIPVTFSNNNGDDIFSVVQNGPVFSFSARNSIEISLNYATYTFCVSYPDCPEYWGAKTLIGLAGNMDGRCENDLMFANGTVVEMSPENQCAYGQYVNAWANSFITSDYYQPIYSVNESCSPGFDDYNVTDWFGKTLKNASSSLSPEITPTSASVSSTTTTLYPWITFLPDQLSTQSHSSSSSPIGSPENAF